MYDLRQVRKFNAGRLEKGRGFLRRTGAEMSKNFKDNELYEARFGNKERQLNFKFWITMLLVLMCILGFRGYWTSNFSGVQVDGASMNNTLYHGEELLMRYYGEGDDLQRGDVIVVYVGEYPEVKAYNAGKSKENQLAYLIKRLIAVEGDAVKCVDGQIYIRYAGEQDFMPLDEPYARYTNRQNYDFDEYTVGKGEIFFLGDNRNHSCDSRYREKGGSHLSGKLYKQTDIFGIVPAWAIQHQKILEKIFFYEIK